MEFKKVHIIIIVFDNIHYITSNILEVHVQNKCTNCFNVILERIDILKLK